MLCLKNIKSINREQLKKAVKNMSNPKNGENLKLTLNTHITIQESKYKAGSGATVNQGVLTKDGKQLPFGIHFENGELKIKGDFYEHRDIDYVEALKQSYLKKRKY